MIPEIQTYALDLYDLLCIFTAIAGAILILLIIWLGMKEDKRREDRALVQELIDAAPWCDPLKVALEPEYQPIIFTHRRRKTHGKKATPQKTASSKVLHASNPSRSHSR